MRTKERLAEIRALYNQAKNESENNSNDIDLAFLGEIAIPPLLAAVEEIEREASIMCNQKCEVPASECGRLIRAIIERNLEGK